MNIAITEHLQFLSKCRYVDSSKKKYIEILKQFIDQKSLCYVIFSTLT